MRHILPAVTFALLAGLALPAQSPKAVSQPTRMDAPAPAAPDSVAWFGTWQQGLAEAKRTGRPILLMAATPQCHGVPGVW